MTRIALICIALLAGCATPAPSVTAPDGARWTKNADGTWTDQLGRETIRDPRTPLCRDVTLKGDTRECVIGR